MIKPHLPERFQGGLYRYFKEKVPPGSFLMAVLTNDLKESFAKADEQSVEELPGLVSWLYNYAPVGMWGSVKNVERHLNAD